MNVRSVSDIPAALRASYEQGGLILTETDLGAEFFDLRSGLAGELFQKFVNYRARLAIVVRDTSAHGDRFSELAREHRRHPNVRVFGDETEARQWLDGFRTTSSE